jgi:hypothetical protein
MLLERFRNFTMPRWKADVAKWGRDHVRRQVASATFHAVRLADLGTVWADSNVDKPMPGGFNGLPVFSSCRLISKTDLAIANKLVQAEKERLAAQALALEQAVDEALAARP